MRFRASSMKTVSYTHLHEWEYTNSLKKCNYKILEKLLHYQGRRAVLRLAIQITGDNRKNQQLEGNPSIDEIAMECAKKLQDMEDERQDVYKRQA